MTGDDEWDGKALHDLSVKWAERIIFLAECGSTNDEARKIAMKGASDLSVILTERQISGRGRRGQSWACPAEEGLAFTLIVRPKESPALWSRLALAAGLAIAEALDSFGVSAGLKWPNDVWVGGKKICGILVEADSGFAVVGVGVNVNVKVFPAGLAHPATSLAIELAGDISREEVLVTCLSRLELRLTQIGSGFEELLEAWLARCVLSGNDVRLDAGGISKTGRVVGVSPRGELLLRTTSGIEKILQAHEIRILN
jgi:BirA family biotin operon repressor/biotin-[acetyl-CoA-carboxylase] ligase